MLPSPRFQCPACLQLVACLLITARLSAAPQDATATQVTPAPAPAPAQQQTLPAPQTTATDDLQPVLQQLVSPDYNTRQQAARQLQHIAESANGLKQLGHALAASPDPETSRRLLDVIEQQFASENYDTPETFLSAEILEQAATARRWDIAETARQSLERSWTRRVEVAIAELVRMRAPLWPKDPRQLWQSTADTDLRFMRPDPTSNNHLKIYIDEFWPADPRAFQLLQRLSGLTRQGRISIYCIQGNPLTPEQLAQVKNTFGDLRVQDRGRVCLGILQERLGGDFTGVLIGRVEKDSSADLAGLKSNDLITHMNGERVTDFEELVGNLKQFRVGDKIKLTVVGLGGFGAVFQDIPPRQPQPEPPKQRDVEVTLKGWYTPDPPAPEPSPEPAPAPEPAQPRD